jgi:hypothetical protein
MFVAAGRWFLHRDMGDHTLAALRT